MSRLVLASWLTVLLFAVPSFAADAAADAAGSAATAGIELLVPSSAAAVVAAAAQSVPLSITKPSFPASDRSEPFSTSRPSILTAMYVSSAALQAYDAYSTLRGISGGAVEANAFMPVQRAVRRPWWA